MTTKKKQPVDLLRLTKLQWDRLMAKAPWWKEMELREAVLQNRQEFCTGEQLPGCCGVSEVQGFEDDVQDYLFYGWEDKRYDFTEADKLFLVALDIRNAIYGRNMAIATTIPTQKEAIKYLTRLGFKPTTEAKSKHGKYNITLWIWTR